MKSLYQWNTASKGKVENTIAGQHYRFTVITEQLVRMEYSAEDNFVDLPSQVISNRDLGTANYEKQETEDEVSIKTKYILLEYQKSKPFCRETLKIHVLSTEGVVDNTWYYGQSYESLKGTVRTLDGIDGPTQLDEGIISIEGYTVIDDHSSLLIQPSGELIQRASKNEDCYFLGYGHEYRKCIQDFYRLTGTVPLLPRYALGNWWSRFHKYTEEEYKELIQQFEKEQIPIVIAVIDIDWHITEVDSCYGSGWTGYTWNRELFPVPKEFMDWLKDHNLKITLNVHPAEGVRSYEDCYAKMAKALGYDVDKKETIPFDPTDNEFLEAYFEYIHYPNERDGVDFWWIDWQQGEETKVPGLDPLWTLNHYHYLDNKKENTRGLILSRYANLGSHRYPVGFSGDTIISWDTLKFQPYFTATASNVGYSWWSHDIGGHMLGKYDEELQVRWVQFGVFSPIMRIHSSASEFNHKEPWNYSLQTNKLIADYMRLRHQLIPYIYTMNWKCYQEGQPLISPMYYDYQECPLSYHVPNQYMFGTQLMVIPVTSPMNQVIKLAKVEAWLPKDMYVDYFTGLIYQGKHTVNLYRSLGEIPVLMEAGTILPLAVTSNILNDTTNPEALTIYVVAGANGTFELYEDDGISFEYEMGKSAVTRLSLSTTEEAEFIIEKPTGDLSVIPKVRRYSIHIMGVAKPENIVLIREGEEEEIVYQYNRLRNELILDDIVVKQEKIKILFTKGLTIGKNEVKERIYQLLDRSEIEFMTKELIYEWILTNSKESVLSSIGTLKIDLDLYGAIMEILLAQDRI